MFAVFTKKKEILKYLNCFFIYFRVYELYVKSWRNRVKTLIFMLWMKILNRFYKELILPYLLPIRQWTKSNKGWNVIVLEKVSKCCDFVDYIFRSYFKIKYHVWILNFAIFEKWYYFMLLAHNCIKRNRRVNQLIWNICYPHERNKNYS